MCTEARYTDSYFIQSIEPRNQNPSSRIALCPRRVSFLKSGPFRLLCSTRQSRLKAGRRSQEAGHQPLTWGPRLGKRYLVGPRTHVLLGAAAVGQVETAGSTVVHGDEGRGSRGRTLDGRSQEACVVPTRGASVRAACRLARWPRLAPPRVLRHGGKEERTAAGVAARQRSARHARTTPASGSGSAHSPLPGSQDGGGKDSARRRVSRPGLGASPAEHSDLRAGLWGPRGPLCAGEGGAAPQLTCFLSQTTFAAQESPRNALGGGELI